MARSKPSKGDAAPGITPTPMNLHAMLLQLDRLEELREELDELGLTSVSEIDARIAELEAIVGDEPDGADDDGADD